FAQNARGSLMEGRSAFNRSIEVRILIPERRAVAPPWFFDNRIDDVKVAGRPIPPDSLGGVDGLRAGLKNRRCPLDTDPGRSSPGWGPVAEGEESSRDAVNVTQEGSSPSGHPSNDHASGEPAGAEGCLASNPRRVQLSCSPRKAEAPSGRKV